MPSNFAFSPTHSSLIPTMSNQPFGAEQLTPNFRNFPTPWLDYSTVAVPDNHELVMWWAQYLWIMDGNFRTAMERVAAHFVTTIDFPDLEPGEESVWKDLFLQFLDYRAELMAAAMDYLCFRGDTRVVARDGIYEICELEGKEVDVLSEGGVYRPAKFKRFGIQELMEVEFSDGRTVLATPEHQWIVESNGGSIRVPTTQLAGRCIERTVAERPERGNGYSEGVRHGFVFGDGSTYNKHRENQFSVANFYGDKTELLPYFEGFGGEPRKYEYSYGAAVIKIHGLPAHYKQLPDPEVSAEYWYGFVSGFLAADGSVDTHGCVILTQEAKETLASIVEQLPRIGMVAGPIRGYTQERTLPEYDGEQRSGETTMHYVTLLKRFMQPEDLLLSGHRAKFEDKWKATNYGKYIHVKSVKETGIVEDVYCCVEHETHSFVIENGILTGNCYGNLVTTLYLPFRRYMRCRRCALEQPIERLSYNLQFSASPPHLIWRRRADCPRCGDSAPYEVVDRRDSDLGKVRINRYDPSDIEIAWNRHSHKKDIYWRIPEEDRRDILGKARIHVDTTPLEVLEAVAVNGRLRFEDNMVFHQAEPNISGIKTRGWGIPRSISNFRTAWLQQLINKLDQAVAIDYTLGIRLISPAETSGSTDPLQTQGLENFASKMSSIVQEHRANPASYHTSPYPVNYQFLGGEGSDVMPADKIKFRQQEYLNQLGVPLEYHQMNLQSQAAPMSLRMFEAFWQGIPSFYNRLLEWVTTTLSRVYNLEDTRVQMQKTTIADDLERKAVLLQLMSANQLSPETALRPYGIDAHEEVKKVFSHEDYVARLQREAEERQLNREEMGVMKGMSAHPTPSQMAMQQQGAAAGGMQPPPPGTPMGGVPAGGLPQMGPTPQSLEAMGEQAEMIAQQLVGLDEYTRKQELKALRESNKDLHALVTKSMEEIRSAARSEGGHMLLSQGAGGV